MIVAMDENHGIGANNDLLWHLPDDFKWFKKNTVGKPVLMGRNTMDSLPKVLPNRLNVVLSSRKENVLEGFVHADSVDKALEICEKEKGEELFVIGGGKIYELFLPKANKLYLTRVHTNIDEADTFFPEIDRSLWNVEYREFHPADDRHKFSFDLEVLVRKVSDK